MAGSSTIEELPPQHKVCIHFHGEKLVHRFVGHLHRNLKSNNIKVGNLYSHDGIGKPLEVIRKRIEESTIALVIFSGKYTESTWCLRELARIMDRVDEGKLVAIPIFYKLDPSSVSGLRYDFGDAFRNLPESQATKKMWKKALKSITDKKGYVVDQNSDENKIIEEIVRWVEGNKEASVDPSENIETEIPAGGNKIVEGVREELNKIPSEGNQEASTKISDVLHVSRPDKPITRPETVFFPAMTGSSTVEQLPPQYQVFINVHGKLSYTFVNRIVEALEREKINVFIDKDEGRFQRLEVPMKTIEESRIALVIFSREYTESGCRLEELVKIADCVEKGKLVAIPVFYKLDQSTMGVLVGQYVIGDTFKHQRARDSPKELWKKSLKLIAEKPGIVVDNMRDLRESDATTEMWKIALKSITEKNGIIVDQKRYLRETEAPKEMWKKSFKLIIEKPGIFVENMSSEKETLKKLVDGVKSVLNKIPSEGSQKAYVDPSEHIDDPRCHLLFFLCKQHIAYMNKTLPLVGEGRAIDKIVENVPNVPEYIPVERKENPRNKFTEFPTAKFGTKLESSSSYAAMNADSLDSCRTFTNSPMDGKVKPTKIQVFINFRGKQLRNNFIGYLVDALRKSGINVFIDTEAIIGDDLNNLFKRIEDCGIAIVVFSSKYTESEFCLDELVKIKERAHQGLLKVLPICYKVTPDNVKRLKGEFGDHFRDREDMYAYDEPKIKRWKEAIAFVSHKHALTFHEKSSALESDFIETIVKEVLKTLQAISSVERGQSSR